MTTRLGGRSAERGCGCGGPSPTCDTRRIVSITRSGDDVFVAFNDCTYLKASMDVVAESVKHSDKYALTEDVKDLVNRVKRLEIRPTSADPRVDRIIENLILVESLQSEAFKALDVAFDPEQL